MVKSKQWKHRVDKSSANSRSFTTTPNFCRDGNWITNIIGSEWNMVAGGKVVAYSTKSIPRTTGAVSVPSATAHNRLDYNLWLFSWHLVPVVYFMLHLIKQSDIWMWIVWKQFLSLSSFCCCCLAFWTWLPGLLVGKIWKRIRSKSSLRSRFIFFNTLDMCQYYLSGFAALRLGILKSFYLVVDT